MYADDLLLLSITLSDLQKMLQICYFELELLDMCINVQKCCCIRIGKRFKSDVQHLTVGDAQIPWENKLLYLGIYFLAGKNLKCDFHQRKAKFFGSLNSLLGKIGTSSPLSVALSLVSSKCFPILTYGLESVKLFKAQLSNLCYVYNAIFSKLFATFDQKVIEQCQFYTGILPLNYQLDLMRLNFFRNLKNEHVSPANLIFNMFGCDDFDAICEKYHILHESHPSIKSQQIWKVFAGNIPLLN